MSTLALLGGPATLDGPLPRFNTIGDAEKEQVDQVLSSGLLSGFYGSWSDEFWGGPKVRELEAAWRDIYSCTHAVSVNSATSGLVAAMGAIRLSPGDEVIVPPFTMSATAMAVLAYGGIPVFVDIDPDTFCLDPELVEQEISPRTRAILVVNLFGHPARLKQLRELADKHNIYLVEDNAQGPLAEEDGQRAGTIGHIGVFSLNCHKHIQTGEGGICTTEDDDLARRMQMIRNHGENVTEPLGISDLTNLVGFNFRMTELSAAVGIAQTEKLPAVIERRCAIAERLSEGLRDIPGLTPPLVRAGCKSTYYVWAARYNAAETGIRRETFAQALTAEGFPFDCGYVAPLYTLPVFRERHAIGRDGFPFNLSNRSYPAVPCPVVERMHHDELITYEICAYDPSDEQLDLMIAAAAKVSNAHDDLRAWEKAQNDTTT